MSSTTKRKPRVIQEAEPAFHACLGRSVPTFKTGGVRLANGPIVKPATLAAIEEWQEDAPVKLTLGELVDELVYHAKATKFIPLKR